MKKKIYYLTLSTKFPSTHIKAGQPTEFEDAFNAGQEFSRKKVFCKYRKLHTIRANYEFWAKRFEKIKTGEACLSVREWVGKPYGKGSTQREIALLTREDGIGIQKLRFDKSRRLPNVDYKPVGVGRLAYNDGLSLEDWKEWFKDYDLSKPMTIIHFTSFRY